MRTKCYKIVAFALSAAMLSCGISPSETAAAKKVTPRLSSTKVSLKVGENKTVKISNAKKAKVKKVKWSISKKAKKIISLQKKSKTSVKIKARKKRFCHSNGRDSDEEKDIYEENKSNGKKENRRF